MAATLQRPIEAGRTTRAAGGAGEGMRRTLQRSRPRAGRRQAVSRAGDIGGIDDRSHRPPSNGSPREARASGPWPARPSGAATGRSRAGTPARTLRRFRPRASSGRARHRPTIIAIRSRARAPLLRCRLHAHDPAIASEGEIGPAHLLVLHRLDVEIADVLGGALLLDLLPSDAAILLELRRRHRSREESAASDGPGAGGPAGAEGIGRGAKRPGSSGTPGPGRVAASAGRRTPAPPSCPGPSWSRRSPPRGSAHRPSCW